MALALLLGSGVGVAEITARSWLLRWRQRRSWFRRVDIILWIVGYVREVTWGCEFRDRNLFGESLGGLGRGDGERWEGAASEDVMFVNWERTMGRGTGFRGC